MKYNNAESTLSADITASGTSIVLKTGEGDLFPSTGYPEKMKIEHFEGNVVTKREVVTISGRTGDILTISSRASEACVQDENLATKTRTQEAFSFSSGDTISMTITEEDYNGIIDDFNTFKDTTVPNTYATKDEVKKSELVYGASSTGTDAYAITVSGITTYQDGMTFRVKSDVANTGACTLDVNGIGAKAVKKQQGTIDLTDGDWAANGIATLVYNSSLDVWQYASQEATVVSTSVSSTSSEFVCGESISAGDALQLVKKLELQQLSETNTGDANSTYYGQTIDCSDLEILEDFYVYYYINNNQQQKDVYIYEDETLANLLGTQSFISQSGVGNKLDILKFSIDVSSYNSIYVRYGIGGFNKYFIRYTTNDEYAGGKRYVNEVASSGDMVFGFTGYTKDGKIYKTNASDINLTNFIGFAKSSGVLDDTIGVDTSGINSNQTGLIPNQTYYLSDTPGQISTTPGTNLLKVGTSLSGNDILIEKGKEFGTPISFSRNVTYTAETDGIVVAVGNHTNTSSNTYMYGLIDGVVYIGNLVEDNQGGQGVSFPVKKGETYRVNYTNPGTLDFFRARFYPLS